MAEYIERDKLLDDFELCNKQNPRWTPQRVKSLIVRATAADVAPVVHGRWIECDYVKYDGHSECIHYPNEAWECSICCHAFKIELLWKDNFCPNCGADMRVADGEKLESHSKEDGDT